MADKKQEEAIKKPGEESSHHGNDKLKLAKLSFREILLLGLVNNSLKET